MGAGEEASLVFPACPRDRGGICPSRSSTRLEIREATRVDVAPVQTYELVR